MKKNLLVFFLIISSFTTLANARFFLGMDAGYSMDKVDVETEPVEGYSGKIITPGSFTKNAYIGNGYLFNINLGTEHHFDKNNYVGIRWLLGLGYGRTNLINRFNNLIEYPSSIIEGKLGLDLLLDVIKFHNGSLGLFGGVEGGGKAVISDDKYKILTTIASFSSLEFYTQARIGLSLFLAEHHRIEFVTKIPVYILNANENIYKPLQFMLGYKFVF